MTNKVSERDFALLDRFLREKPNASIQLQLKALFLFSQNKTRKWLDTKSFSEKSRLLQAARKLTPKFRQRYKEIKKEINLHRSRVIKEKQKEKERKKEESIRRALTDEVVMNDWFWQSKEEVEQKLRTTKSVTKQKENLKNQLKFRKLVLQQEYAEDRAIFIFSTKGKQKYFQ